MGIRKNSAFTLQELLIVIGIIAIMMVILITSGHALKKQADLRDARGTLLILSTALEKYHELHGVYPFEAAPYLPGVLPDDTDDSGYNRNMLAADITSALGAATYTPFVYSEQKNYQASIEALYFFLERDTAANEILSAIPAKYLTVKDADDAALDELLFSADLPDPVPLIRILDPWGNPYRYVYEAGYGVAIVESAGPDGMFARVPASEDNDDEKQKDLDNISY